MSSTVANLALKGTASSVGSGLSKWTDDLASELGFKQTATEVNQDQLKQEEEEQQFRKQELEKERIRIEKESDKRRSVREARDEAIRKKYRINKKGDEETTETSEQAGLLNASTPAKDVDYSCMDFLTCKCFSMS